MKKILSVILVLVLVLCCFPIMSISAASEAIVVKAVPSKTIIGVGDTFTVDFNVTTNKGFNTLGLSVGYDSDVLEVVCPKHEDGSKCIGTRLPVTNMLAKSPDGATNVASCSPYHDTNPYRIMWAFALAEVDVVATGRIATLTFKVKDDVAVSYTTITLDVDVASNNWDSYNKSELVGVDADISICTNHTYSAICDEDCNLCGKIRTVTHSYDNACDTDCNVCGKTRTITHSYDNACDTDCNVCAFNREIEHNYGNDGSCDICNHKKYTPGDANNDANVDLTDIVTLAQFVADWDVECNEDALDVNGDGNVDLTDVVHLAQYVAEWDGIELH